MPYDHYLFDMPEMEEALDDINEEHAKIIAAFYLSDSNQVCLITHSDNISVDKALKSEVDKALKSLFDKRED